MLMIRRGVEGSIGKIAEKGEDLEGCLDGISGRF
jgi:hypothetical protein